MNDPIRPEDFRLLLSLLDKAICQPGQRERTERFLRDQQAIVDALAQLERDLRAAVRPVLDGHGQRLV